MRVYHYDNLGIIQGHSDADESPLEPGEFLIPAFSTPIKPNNNELAFNGTTWEKPGGNQILGLMQYLYGDN
jgi:hypothetical protein